MTPARIIVQSYLFSFVGWVTGALCIYRAIVDINRGTPSLAIVMLIMAFLQARVILVAQRQRESARRLPDVQHPPYPD